MISAKTIYFANKTNFCIGTRINDALYSINEYSFWTFRLITDSVPVEKWPKVIEDFERYPCKTYTVDSTNSKSDLYWTLKNNKFIDDAANVNSVFAEMWQNFRWTMFYTIYYSDNRFVYAATLPYSDGGFEIRKYDASKVLERIYNVASANSKDRFSKLISNLKPIEKSIVSGCDVDMLTRLQNNDYVCDTGNQQLAAVNAHSFFEQRFS